MENFRSGLVASAVYNVNRDATKHPDPIEPLDFFETKQKQEEHPVDVVDEYLASSLDVGLRLMQASIPQ